MTLYCRFSEYPIRYFQGILGYFTKKYVLGRFLSGPLTGPLNRYDTLWLLIHSISNREVRSRAVRGFVAIRYGTGCSGAGQRGTGQVRKQRSTPTCSDLNIADFGVTIRFGTVQGVFQFVGTRRGNPGQLARANSPRGCGQPELIQIFVSNRADQGGNRIKERKDCIYAGLYTIYVHIIKKYSIQWLFAQIGAAFLRITPGGSGRATTYQLWGIGRTTTVYL